VAVQVQAIPEHHLAAQAAAIPAEAAQEVMVVVPNQAIQALLHSAYKNCIRRKLFCNNSR
jgi:hypothetical protein